MRTLPLNRAHSVVDLNNSRSGCPLEREHALLDITLAQLYCCVMIPDFDENGNLPPGVYEAQWDELVQRFGWTSRYLELPTKRPKPQKG